MKIVDQAGASESHDWKSGQALWLPANPPGTLHTDVNAGDKPIEVMVVELKKAMRSPCASARQRVSRNVREKPSVSSVTVIVTAPSLPSA